MDKDKSERRRHPRYSFRAQVKGHENDLLVLDLSREGVRLIGDFKPNSDSIELKLELGGAVHNCVGKVAWFKPVGYSGRYQVGIRFEKLERIEAEHQEGPLFNLSEPRGSLRDLSSDELNRLKTLAGISSKLNESNHTDELLGKMMECLVHHLNAERALLLTPEGQGFAVSKVAGSQNENFSKRVVDQVLKSGAPLLSLDAADDVRLEDSQSIQMLGTRSVLCVPVVAGEKCLGLIYLDNSVSVNAFGQPELHLASIVADMAASALEKARLVEFLSDSQRDLAAAHEELHSLVELNSEGILVLDSRANIRFNNPTAGRFLLNDFQSIRETGTLEGQRTEIAIQRQNGSTGVAEISVERTRWDNEEAYLVTLRDVTEWREREARLRQSQKMEAIGRLAGGIAHDFNNLLTAILGSSELMQANSPEDRTELETIQESARRAATLTQQLLTFSQKRVRKPEMVQLDQVFDALKNTLSGVVGEKIELKISDSGESLPVMADEGEITQLILNLIVNARDATKGEGCIEVALFSETVRGARFGVLSVTDTGVGMDNLTRERVFEPFFSTKSGAIGLGLSTVYGIVHSSGGRIEVESTPGKGSRFRIFLPLLNGEPRTPPKVARPSITPGKGRVILVEDESAVRDLVARILLRAGYQVTDFGSAEPALELELEEYDLLLSDVMLPGMNGLELARKLTEKRPSLKVLLMSGYSEGVLDQQGNSTEDFPFIHKPFELSELTAKIGQVMGEGVS